jgi:hypothetical protein
MKLKHKNRASKLGIVCSCILYETDVTTSYIAATFKKGMEIEWLFLLGHVDASFVAQ